MPPKVRALAQALRRAGFVDHGGKGSHRNFVHPAGLRVTLSGQPGADAKPYQEREVAQQLAAAGATKRGRS